MTDAEWAAANKWAHEAGYSLPDMIRTLSGGTSLTPKLTPYQRAIYELRGMVGMLIGKVMYFGESLDAGAVKGEDLLRATLKEVKVISDFTLREKNDL